MTDNVLYPDKFFNPKQVDEHETIEAYVDPIDGKVYCKYAVQYEHKGAEWVIFFWASDEEDAKERVASIGKTQNMPYKVYDDGFIQT